MPYAALPASRRPDPASPPQDLLGLPARMAAAFRARTRRAADHLRSGVSARTSRARAHGPSHQTLSLPPGAAAPTASSRHTPRPIHEEPSGSAPHLERDATGAPRHDRSFLPERLGDDKPEALADRLLYHHVREALKGIDLDVSHPGKVGEEVDLKIVFGCLPDLAVDLPSFRVVERHRASQRQLQPGHLRLDEPVGLYHPQRVLPRVEAGNLGYEGSLGLDADPPQQTARDAGVKLEVLRALRIDRRRNDLHALDWDVRRDEAAEREDRRIVAF